MELEQTRDLLLQAMEQRLADDRSTVDTNRILADQKTAYENEARGTYYSGLPTWQRTQNAVEAAEKLANVNQNYAKNTVSIWSSIEDTLDKINAYNEAAAILGAGTTGITPGVSSSRTSSAPFIMNGKYYQYVDGRLQEVK